MKKVVPCPECKSDRTVYLGYHYNRSGKHHRRLCYNCGHVFLEKEKVMEQ